MALPLLSSLAIDGKSFRRSSSTGVMATWNIDPLHSKIGFRVRHFGITWVHGWVPDLRGTVEFDPEQPSELR